MTESLKTPFPVLLLPLCDQARVGTITSVLHGSHDDLHDSHDSLARWLAGSQFVKTPSLRPIFNIILILEASLHLLLSFAWTLTPPTN